VTRALVVSTDPVTATMPGPAIRAWHLADALADRHEVALVSTVECTRTHDRVRLLGPPDPDTRTELERWMDVAIIPAGAFHEWPSLAATDKVLVVDVYDPYHLENLEPSTDASLHQRHERLSQLNGAINQHLVRGDFFLCASERQRDFWLGSLTALGRVNPYTYEDDPGADALVVTVPFGLSADPPRRTGPGLRGVIDGVGADDKVVLWAGGVYNWFDPCSVIAAIDRLRASRRDIRLVFLGMQHPNPAIPTMRAAVEARALADRLQLTGTHVFFNEGWVPYDERANALLDADVGVSTHLDHIETRYSFRTRILDYLWAGLPMVLTEGDVLADLVRDEGLGKTVPAGDVAALERALDDILSTPPPRDRFGPVAERLRWDRVADPLVDFCRDPRPARDRTADGPPARLSSTRTRFRRTRRGQGQ